MKKQQDLDYRLYQVYVWGGLALFVIYFFIAVLVFEAHNLPNAQLFLVLLMPLMLWIAGIFAYWWWVFLFKDRKEVEGSIQKPEGGVPGIQSLRSLSSLHQAMAISGGDKAELIKNYRRAKLPVLLWFGTTNLMALWICCPITLGTLEIIEGLSLGTWLAGMVAGIVLMLVGTPFLLQMGSKKAEKAFLAPLGLEFTELHKLNPEVVSSIAGGQLLIPEGPAVIEGERHGRLVHIETLGINSLTVVQARLPEFKVKSEAGKLTPEKGAPDRVVAATKSLRKAKRWQGIQVYAGPDGIGVHRQSKGTNMWLYDLWLAEYLLEKFIE
jgi:hypothetical protein